MVPIQSGHPQHGQLQRFKGIHTNEKDKESDLAHFNAIYSDD